MVIKTKTESERIVVLAFIFAKAKTKDMKTCEEFRQPMVVFTPPLPVQMHVARLRPRASGPLLTGSTTACGTDSPDGRPLVANLNVSERETVPNMSLIPYSDTGAPYLVKVYNHYGSMHYLLDVYAIVLK